MLFANKNCKEAAWFKRPTMSFTICSRGILTAQV